MRRKQAQCITVIICDISQWRWKPCLDEESSSLAGGADLGRCRAALMTSIRQMSSKLWRGSACEYQADERAGVVGDQYMVAA